MIYADETFYIDKFLLGRKSVIRIGFPFYARQASEIIDRYTFGRVKRLTDIPEEIQMCCCELAEAEYRREKQQKESGGKISEKIGTYSVSFGSNHDLEVAASRERYHIVTKWLLDTGLCYQGVE